MKLLILLIAAFTISYSAYSQTKANISNIKSDKVRLTKTTIVQDSALATFPALVSVKEKDYARKSPSLQESFAAYSVDFYPEPENGIVYVKFANLSKEIKPLLYLYDEKGNELYSIKAKTRLNIINLREIPSGTYLLTAEVDKEVTTWEIVKE